MTIIKILFPWGRYYAHPWGINPVRLREPEWPPSPWRLLRALTSCWHRKYPGIAVSREAVMLIESLGRHIPEIGIGKVSFGYTVHYQPNYGAADKTDREAARYKNTRHENHFAAVHGPVIFRWPNLPLPPAQEGLLGTLLSELSYFGRAESICQAELISGDAIEALGAIGWCRPTGGRRISSQCRDVFCPNWADFRITDLWARRADKPQVNSPITPRHLVDALLSSDMKPDGAQWVSYQMPGDWPENRLVRMPRTANKNLKAISDGPRIAHYLRFSLQCRVAISPKFTVPLAEEFRSEASRCFLRRFGSDHVSFALFGHQKDRPMDLTEEHQHAFYLPTPGLGDHGGLEEPGFITELHVWCPYGFTQAETQVLLSVQRLNWKDGRYPIRPVLTSMSVQPPPGVPLATGAVKSRIWRSETPFVPPRHFYRDNSKRIRNAESPEKQLIGCLSRSKINVSGKVHRLSGSGGEQKRLESLPPTPLWEIVRAPEGDEIPWTSAVIAPTHINGSSMKSQLNRQRIGFFMEIAFEKEVALPVPAFGHSNHFGLGLFLPVGG